MADTPQPGPQPGMPFGFGHFDLNEVVRLLKSEGPLNFEVARQVAAFVAQQGPGQGESPLSGPAGGSVLGLASGAIVGPGAGPGPEEAPVDPAFSALMDELTRTAVMHVDEVTGLAAGLNSRPKTLTRLEWANEALDGLAPLLVTLAERLTAIPGDGPEGVGGPEMPDLAALFPDGVSLEGMSLEGGANIGDLSHLLTAMAPLLLGIQAGFMAGHLASLTLARHEMPLPLSTHPAITYVAPNILDFQADWELPREELAFYVALHEVAYAAMLGVSWVHDRVVRLATEYVGAFEVNAEMVEDRFAGLDPMNPETFESAMGDPSELLGAMRTPAQERTRAQITGLTALLEGYADWVLSEVGPALIPSFDRIREASHRHRVERGEASKFLEALLGFEAPRSDLELGAAFCAGVVERAGGAGLARLFEDESRLPTQAELEAPGLWLERIDLPEP